MYISSQDICVYSKLCFAVVYILRCFFTNMVLIFHIVVGKHFGCRHAALNSLLHIDVCLMITCA